MIRLNDITLRRGPEPLLQGAEAQIPAGHTVGLIGANGAGKSSLLALLRGELAPDQGSAQIPAGWRIAWLEQETPAEATSALDFVLDGDRPLREAEAAVAVAEASGAGNRIAEAYARLEAADGYTARARGAELLHGLGFEPGDEERPVAEFSGGWRVRLGLARTLMAPSDLLLLDEPTNHLDLPAVLWLERWLAAYKGTLVLISHDREMLDRIADSVLHFEGQQLVHYAGGYTAFEHQRAERLARQQAIHEKQERERRHMQQFIDRFRAKASKARAAQSRIKALERMERVAPAHVDSPFHFRLPQPPSAADPLVTMRDAGLGYGEDAVLAGVTRSLAQGDRVGLLGPNGAGKSTLIRALAAGDTCLYGEVQQAPSARVGYFAQHQLEQLDGAASPLLHLQRLAPEQPEQSLRDFLGSFAFSGDLAKEPVERLSGGQRARLALALIAWRRPNLLLLDEPTNHLDLEMRHALTVALQEYPGAVVVVSHDRQLLATTVERYWLVADGAVRDFDGDLDEYRDWLQARERAATRQRRAQATEGVGEVAQHGAQARKDQRRRDAERRAALRPLQKRVDELVTAIEARDRELAELEEQLSDPALYESAEANARLTELLQRQGALRQDREQLEEAWMEAEQALEDARTA